MPYIRVLTVSVVGSILLTACGDAGSDHPTQTDNKSVVATDREEHRTFNLGQPVNFEAFEITINTVEQRQQVGMSGAAAKASDGGTLVAVTYSLKNTGKKPLGMFDRPSLKLVDPSGQTYDPDINATMLFSVSKEFSGKSISDLNPGITTKDGIVWEVSKEKFSKKDWTLALDGHDNSSISLQAK